MEFRKEDDKEEAVQGSDPPTFSGNPAHISHRRPHTTGCGARRGQDQGAGRPGASSTSGSAAVNNSAAARGTRALRAAAQSRNAALETQWGEKKPLQEDDIHLHCCLVSKVRRRLGIRQLRRGNGTSCYWQGTDVWGKVGIRRAFFFWQKSTRDAVWLPPHEREPLKHTDRLACKHFWFYTPKTSDCAADASVCGPGVKTCRVRRHGSAHSSKRSGEKTGWGVENMEGKKRKDTTNSSQTSTWSLTLLPRSVHAPTYTQANTQIQDVGSQFSKHSPYPLAR